jgi:hypothetical protein
MKTFFFLEPGWGSVLERKFSADPRLGLVGLAGTQYLFQHTASWAAAGRPFIRGLALRYYVKSDVAYSTPLF